MTLEVVRILGIRGTGGFKIQKVRRRDLAQDVASFELKRGRSGEDSAQLMREQGGGRIPELSW